MFGLLKAQKSNPGHNFRLLASLKGKSQNSFLGFEFHAAPSMRGAQTPPSGCRVAAILRMRSTSHDHVAARMEPVASVQLVRGQDAFVFPIGDLTVSMLVGKVERGTIVVPFVGSMPQNYGSCVRHRN